jgi:hypothetical protein
LICMKHINRIVKLSDKDYSSLSQDVDTDFFHAWANYLHWFPIAWFGPVLNRTELEVCGAASLIGEIPKIIEARSNKIQRLHSHHLYYISFYIFCKFMVRPYPPHFPLN